MHIWFHCTVRRYKSKIVQFVKTKIVKAILKPKTFYVKNFQKKLTFSVKNITYTKLFIFWTDIIDGKYWYLTEIIEIRLWKGNYTVPVALIHPVIQNSLLRYISQFFSALWFHESIAMMVEQVQKITILLNRERERNGEDSFFVVIESPVLEWPPLCESWELYWNATGRNLPLLLDKEFES